MPRLEDLVKAVREAKEEKQKLKPSFSDLIQAHPELQITECSCGRPFSFAKIHCPSCGNSPMYVKQPIEAIMPDGTVVMTAVYRCRRCPRVYTEHEVYFNCKAPVKQVKRTIQEKKVDLKVMEYTQGMTPNDLVKALIEKRQREGKSLGQLEKFVEQNGPKPGTPEWYEEHPKES